VTDWPAAFLAQTYPDWAHRMSDVLNQAVLTPGCAGRVIAIRLADGGSDGVVYDTRADAITHQHGHETWCDYIVIKPTAYSPRDCYDRLNYTRAMYDAGWRWDLDSPAPILPVRREDMAGKLAQLRTHARSN
jgi:hypothetical protein